MRTSTSISIGQAAGGGPILIPHIVVRPSPILTRPIKGSTTPVVVMPVSSTVAKGAPLPSAAGTTYAPSDVTTTALNAMAGGSTDIMSKSKAAAAANTSGSKTSAYLIALVLIAYLIFRK